MEQANKTQTSNMEMLTEEELKTLRSGKSPWPNTCAPARPSKNILKTDEKRIAV